MSKDSSFSFEQSLDALQATVEQLESGDLTLEEALQAFEKGISLTRECQNALNKAQERINILLERNGELVEEPASEISTQPIITDDNEETHSDEDIPF